tara:strand:+ start:3265 stop:3546 length:282 start_codon:yes stop_codon:yes gene_type:complete
MEPEASIQDLVKARGETYGRPHENHARTAALWDVYLRHKSMSIHHVLSADDVCFMNMLQKISRCMSRAGPSKDTLKDIQGFAENILIMHKDLR